MLDCLSRRRPFIALLTLAVLVPTARVLVQGQGKKNFSVSAHKYGYAVEGSATPEIHVSQGDLVRITFTSDDIPHSFTVEDDTYRIMKRADPGRTVTFDFLADKAGKFPFKCTLTIDDRCKEMLGWLIVAPRKEGRRPFSGE
jgi:heme/copper-type cytochrome/quinol oxidase subunit 2